MYHQIHTTLASGMSTMSCLLPLVMGLLVEGANAASAAQLSMSESSAGNTTTLTTTITTLTNIPTPTTRIPGFSALWPSSHDDKGKSKPTWTITVSPPPPEPTEAPVDDFFSLWPAPTSNSTSTSYHFWPPTRTSKTHIWTVIVKSAESTKTSSHDLSIPSLSEGESDGEPRFTTQAEAASNITTNLPPIMPFIPVPPTAYPSPHNSEYFTTVAAATKSLPSLSDRDNVAGKESVTQTMTTLTTIITAKRARSAKTTMYTPVIE